MLISHSVSIYFSFSSQNHTITEDGAWKLALKLQMVYLFIKGVTTDFPEFQSQQNDGDVTEIIPSVQGIKY